MNYLKCQQSQKNALNRLFMFFTAAFVFLGATAQTTKALWVGESYQCDATSAIVGSYTNLSWSTSGGYISLSGSGLYRNVKATQYFSGTASVTCSWKYTLYYGGRQYSGSRTWYFTCQENPVSIYPTSMTLTVGETGNVSFSHKYSNSYTSEANAYYSCTSSCVSVSSSGVITAKSPGTAYVYVYSKLSNASNAPYCMVTVKKKPVAPTAISLYPDTMKIREEETKSFIYTLSPQDATAEVSWSTSDPSIATVSSDGTVTGIEAGKATITATTSNGLKAVGVVEVTPTVKQISIENKTVYEGFFVSLKPAILPVGVETSLNWESSDQSIAFVDASGLVRARKAGIATITVTADNGRSGTANIIVKEIPEKESYRNVKVRVQAVNKLISKSIQTKK